MSIQPRDGFEPSRGRRRPRENSSTPLNRNPSIRRTRSRRESSRLARMQNFFARSSPLSVLRSHAGRGIEGRRRRAMKKLGRFGLVAALLCALAAFQHWQGVHAAGGPVPSGGGQYRVLDPIESGNLLLFPVVKADGNATGDTPFIT